MSSSVDGNGIIQTHRSESLRSVASNSSLASTVSLTRRPRTTRARSRTGEASPRLDRSAEPSPVMLFFEKPVNSDPVDALSPESPPARPPRSPARVSMDPLRPQAAAVQRDVPGKIIIESPAVKPAFPNIVTDRRIPSAFSRVPSLSNIRDSVASGFTQQSGISSSLYPASTSAASGTESPPSPRSILEPDEEMNIPVVNEAQDYDGDDVSYRLRLLVKNSYFLPPAHSKPSSADLSPSLPKKPNAPGFLDLFRVGKSRSKPVTPAGVNQTFDLSPALRTASDATAPAYTLVHPSIPRSPRPPGRVVVVRETMADLVTAAKQAEQEMKIRSARRDQGSQREPANFDDLDVIDPTDAVDLPPPSPNSPFTPQASALRGLGVQDSIGAGELANLLAPGTPGFGADNDWRRALLHTAVAHSLDNLQASPSPTAATDPRKALAQRIVDNPIIESSGETQSPKVSSEVTGDSFRLSSMTPDRSETPSVPLIPLVPPPRKPINPLYSLSQTDLPLPVEPVPPLPTLSSSEIANMKTFSSPRPSGESNVRHVLTMTPPPAAFLSHPRGRQSRTSLDSFSDGATSSSSGRPSLSQSEGTHLSPTNSAFRDLRRDDGDQRNSIDQASVLSNRIAQRNTATSPSAVGPAPIALSLPPRKSSLHHRRTTTTVTTKSLASEPGHSFSRKEPNEILAPEPATPPFPTPSQPLSLRIPHEYISPGLRSAPPGASVTPSFFDSIQSQPNAMDDLDSSSDESESDSDDEEVETRARSIERPSIPSGYRPRSSASSMRSSSRSLFTRLGNHSSPHISRQPDEDVPGLPDRRKPIGNVPQPGPSFSEKLGSAVSTFDIYQYAQGSLAVGLPDSPPPDGKKLRTRESVQRLDDVLIQHMKAEKDRFKQIASNSVQSDTRRNRHAK
ncbi:hypothetical protein C8J56DRAFT_487802 [Mycena floridula]|nr:hypothetical protein C8J56DRAFT_487802 [Mycena floridula]